MYRKYGPQGWWPGEGPFEVIVGAILTQAAAWSNVEMALGNLKKVGCWSLAAIQVLPETELAALIRPSGYFNVKARKLKAFANHVGQYYGGDLDRLLEKDTAELREELLSIYGVGPETADDILVYAAGRPCFVIDSYTRRILGRVGLTPLEWSDRYRLYQQWFHDRLPPDPQLFNEFHALLDRHAKEACQKVSRCSDCCLREVCEYGQETRS
ncbi:MAG: endonuclease III domain-containing protein [Dehalococcoidia bacterium]